MSARREPGSATSQPVVTITLALYVEHLQRVVEESVRLPQAVAADKPTRWQRQLAMLRKRQRVYGPLDLIRGWIESRGMQLREAPLP